MTTDDNTPMGPDSADEVDDVEEDTAGGHGQETQGQTTAGDGDGDEDGGGGPRGPKQKQNRPKKRNQSITSHRVQCFGRKKRALALAMCGDGYGMIRVNGRPLDLIEPKPMRMKVYEPLLLVGRKKYQDLDIHIRVKGGGHVSQIYAVRQAIAKSLLAWHAKFVDEASKCELRKTFLRYDRNLIVSDPRRRESKKFGGPGPRARYQKSYR